MNKELLSFIEEPFSPGVTYDLAYWYYKQGHTASALAFYLRTVETSQDRYQIYECLCLIGLCMIKQGNRFYFAKGAFLHAINLLPNRPEAYHLMSRTCEWSKEWQDSYTWANLGLLQKETEPIPGLEYYGRQALLFEKAVSAWWINRIDESLEILIDLDKHYELPVNIKDLVKKNIANITMINVGCVYYNPTKNLRFPFPDHKKIRSSYSQAMQDMFVLAVLKGKKRGVYLEIGSNEPFYLSNTALLEIRYGWRGLSIEILKEFVDKFNLQRKNPCIQQDAMQADWYTILGDTGLGKVWDYLQVDCDPPDNSLAILFSIPFDEYKFRVITFEHDEFIRPGTMVRERSRNFLRLLGYKLIVPNVSVGDKYPFEDWYVHPDLVDMKNVAKMIPYEEVTDVEKYMFR
jgi:hypothetical protein